MTAIVSEAWPGAVTAESAVRLPFEVSEGMRKAFIGGTEGEEAYYYYDESITPTFIGGVEHSTWPIQATTNFGSGNIGGHFDRYIGGMLTNLGSGDTGQITSLTFIGLGPSTSATRWLGGNPAPAAAEIATRLAALLSIAAEEGITPVPASEADFRRFIAAHPSRSRPRIYLLETGNFRAVWLGGRGEQLALQFLGGGQIKFVIFARRPNDAIARSMGVDTFRGIELQIDAMGVRQLLDK